MSHVSKSERVPLLCYVTDRRSLAAADPGETRKILLQRIRAAVATGVDWIQIREKDLSGREYSELTREALRMCANPALDANYTRAPAGRTRIIVNERLDVALAMHAGGVHLGEQSLPPQEGRRLLKSLHRGENFLIGASCHSLEGATAAEQGGADYLFFGPVFATPSKAAYGAPQGLERLSKVCQAVAVPVLAIGGITLENAASCRSAGAAGIAAIRLFQDAPNMAEVVRTLRERLARSG